MSHLLWCSCHLVWFTCHTHDVSVPWGAFQILSTQMQRFSDVLLVVQMAWLITGQFSPAEFSLNPDWICMSFQVLEISADSSWRKSCSENYAPVTQDNPHLVVQFPTRAMYSKLSWTTPYLWVEGNRLLILDERLVVMTICKHEWPQLLSCTVTRVSLVRYLLLHL